MKNPTTKLSWPERLRLSDEEWRKCLYHTKVALDEGNIPATLFAIELLLKEDRDKVNWDEVTNALGPIVATLLRKSDD